MVKKSESRNDRSTKIIQRPRCLAIYRAAVNDRTFREHQTPVA